MKKQIWLVIILAIIMVVLLGVLFLVPAKKVNLPVVNGIEVTSPKPNEEVSLPIKIAGTVNGNGWSGFEGQVGTFKLFLKGDPPLELATGFLSATTPWTTLPTSFEIEISSFLVNCVDCVNGDANLIFYNENPSGLPDKDRFFTLPVKIKKSSGEIMKVKAFFNNNIMDQEISCNKVFAIERDVPKTTAVAQAAIDELLNGVTDAEKNAGFFTSIPAGSKLNSISIVSGEARADFNAITESGGGSCSMAARVAQITKTLMQFPTITSVRLSVDGRTGDVIFQP